MKNITVIAVVGLLLLISLSLASPALHFRIENNAAPENDSTPTTGTGDASEPENNPGTNKTNTEEQDTVSGTGTIRYLYFEGGFYGIVSDDGKHYDPTNLSPEFQTDGLRVSFKIKTLENMCSFHMWGTLVIIITIEKINQ
jgi:hypothetical protein